MSHSEDKCNGKGDDNSARSSTDACISLANVWADKALAKYRAECAISKRASTFDFLSSADTIEDKSAIMAGRERGVTTLQVFDEGWNNAEGNSR